MDTKKCELIMGRGGRRSKNDPYGRVYKCGCGKSYLSYPALYTHVKKKHQGAQPEGTIAPAVNRERVRGRPPKTTCMEESNACLEEEQILIEHCRYGGPTDPLASFKDTHEGLGYEVRKLIDTYGTLEDLELPEEAGLQTVIAQYLAEVSQFVDADLYRTIVVNVSELQLNELSDIEGLFNELIHIEPKLKYLTVKHLINWLYANGYFDRYAV
mmetsp:Transcript_7814/g.14984  ORF Transcript_7814/g.14984 Transcript_7814/m.14984 type:complete len:213 (-) Transcript_7814:303-941(-)